MNQESTLQLVDIHLLFESPTNPRKTFDQPELEELANSIRQQGVLQNLVVRPMADKFEIVAGARRYRASKMAGLKQVPAAIRELSDEQVLDIQIVENLLRKDVHPLEEAEGYQNLLNSNKRLTVADIAHKVCKSETYVYQRLKLNDLTEACQDPFRRNILSISHAILLARLQHKDQDIALKFIAVEYDWENDKEDSIIEVRKVSDLNDWIEDNILLDLADAKFDTSDETLYPEAGPCTICPKRTGYNTTLFPDLQEDDRCTDRSCFQKKKSVFFESLIAPIKEKEGKAPVKITEYYSSNEKGVIGSWKYKKSKKAECEFVETAIILDGKNFGKKIFICRKQDCKTHWESYSPSRGNSSMSPEEKVKQDKAAQKREDDERVRFLIGFAIAGNESMLFTKAECKEVVEDKWDSVDSDYQTLIAREFKWITPDEVINWKNYSEVLENNIEDLSHLQLFQLMKLIVMEEVVCFQGKKNTLMEFAKIYGIDKKEIEKKVSADRKAAEKAEKEKTAIEEKTETSMGRGLKALLDDAPEKKKGSAK